MRRRRLTRREKRSKRKKAVIVSTLCLLFVMTAGYAAFQTNLSITAKGNIKEPSRVIRSWTGTSQEDFHSDYYKENIVSATFLDTNQVVSNATESWDVSEDGKGGVKAWVVPNTEDTTKYDLYIGANKGVIANEDSSGLFYNFTNITSINFGKNFDTSNVVNMATMFAGCNSLISLDLSFFDTKNVTSLEDIFVDCFSLTTINLSGWNTSNVKNMRGSFYRNTSLTTINLRSFDTSNVTNMRAMFMGAINLTEIDLCNFDTRNVKTMMDMFANTNNLEKVIVGSNWTTANADTANMFNGSGVSSVTTGQC